MCAWTTSRGPISTHRQIRKIRYVSAHSVLGGIGQRFACFRAQRAHQPYSSVWIGPGNEQHYPSPPSTERAPTYLILCVCLCVLIEPRDVAQAPRLSFLSPCSSLPPPSPYHLHRPCRLIPPFFSLFLAISSSISLINGSSPLPYQVAPHSPPLTTTHGSSISDNRHTTLHGLQPQGSPLAQSLIIRIHLEHPCCCRLLFYVVF
jgi:hypothetical protein